MTARTAILGKTGLSVLRIGFGSWAIGGSRSGWGYGPTDDRMSLRTVSAALDHGCNFFDTADSYGNGHSEELLGKALRNLRTEVVIAGKVGYDFYHQPSRQNFHPSYIRFALHQSLRRLKSDFIDVYQLHNPPPEVIVDPEVISALEALRRQGKVRWIGVSAAEPHDAIVAIHAGWPDTIQVTYNMLVPDAERELFPLAFSRQIGVIAREPLANGFLSGKYGSTSRFLPEDVRSVYSADDLGRIAGQVGRIESSLKPGESLVRRALGYALDHKAVSVAVVGNKTVEQVEENFFLDPGPQNRPAGQR